jgi:hypothetical protein
MTDDVEGELNPFEAFTNTADLYAFMFAEHEADALRELLVTVDCDQQRLLQDAAELNSLGRNQAAEIVAEAAKDFPSAASECPFDPETDQANHWDWHARQQRNAKRATWAPLPDRLFGCCNGLKPGERPLNWDIIVGH